MTKNLEEDKLLGEFVGRMAKAGSTTRYTFAGVILINDNNVWYSLKEARFHDSWDWLMAVVKKIEWLDEGKKEMGMMSYIFTINRIHSFIEKIDDYNKPPFIQVIVDYHNEMGENSAKTKLEATYKAVVEFVKWYNKQK